MKSLIALLTLLVTTFHSAPPEALTPVPASRPEPSPISQTTTPSVPKPPPVPTVAPEEAGRVAVLIYHHLATPEEAPEAPGTISPQRLESHLKMLRDEGYHLITAAEFASFLDGQLVVPERSVFITLDDGYASNYYHGFPLFQKYKAPVLIFPIMKYFESEGKGAWHLHLTQEQAAEMLSSGLVSFGSHTYDGHVMLPTDAKGEKKESFLSARRWLPAEGRQETEAEAEARVRADLERSAAALRTLGIKDDFLHFALPYGYGAERADLLRSVGFRYIYLVEDKELNLSAQTKLIHRLDGGNPWATADWLKARLERLFSNS